MDDYACLICGVECRKIPCLGCERNELKLKLEVAVAALKKISHMQSPHFLAEEAIEVLGLKPIYKTE